MTDLVQTKVRQHFLHFKNQCLRLRVEFPSAKCRSQNRFYYMESTRDPGSMRPAMWALA
jgi:hypothetical protein